MYELDVVKNHKCPASALFNSRGDPFSTVHCPQSLDTFEHFPLQTTQFSWVQGTFKKLMGSRRH